MAFPPRDRLWLRYAHRSIAGLSAEPFAFAQRRLRRKRGRKADPTRTSIAFNLPYTERQRRTTKQPSTKQPSTKQPSTKQPSTKQPSTKQLLTKQLLTKQPSTKQPSTKQLSTKQLSTKQPWPKATLREQNKEPPELCPGGVWCEE
nr:MULTISPECIES: hypothetical protein [unclassified Moorena]